MIKSTTNYEKLLENYKFTFEKSEKTKNNFLNYFCIFVGFF